MSKNRILSILESELGVKFKNTKILRQLGNASMKSVVEGESEANEVVAFAVIDPYAKDQSTSHLRFGKVFVENLKNEGLIAESNIVINLLSSIERQLVVESDSVHEASIMKAVAVKLNKIQKKQDRNYRGWKVTVPKLSKFYPVTKHVLPMSLADGYFFENLPNSEKTSAGFALVSSLLDLLFEEGIFDGDRHIRQQFFNFKDHQKEIVLFDWGQGERFNTRLFNIPDDRTTIAEFLYSIAERNGIYTATVLAKMSESLGKEQDSKIIELGDKINKLFRRNIAPKDESIELFKLANESNFILYDRFGVGFIKGLLTLLGENYVTNEDMTDLLKEKMIKHFKSKWPFSTRLLTQSQRLKNPKTKTDAKIIISNSCVNLY
jgi:hypothetical protein